MRFYGILAVILTLAIFGAESNKIHLFCALALRCDMLSRLEPVQAGARARLPE